MKMKTDPTILAIREPFATAPRTQWFNVSGEPPARSGWYEVRKRDWKGSPFEYERAGLTNEEGTVAYIEVENGKAKEVGRAGGTDLRSCGWLGGFEWRGLAECPCNQLQNVPAS